MFELSKYPYYLSAATKSDVDERSNVNADSFKGVFIWEHQFVIVLNFLSNISLLINVCVCVYLKMYLCHSVQSLHFSFSQKHFLSRLLFINYSLSLFCHFPFPSAFILSAYNSIHFALSYIWLIVHPSLPRAASINISFKVSLSPRTEHVFYSNINLLFNYL